MCVILFATPQIVARQDPLFVEFSRQEYWRGLPFLSPGDLSDLGMEPMSPALQVDSLPLSHWGRHGSSQPHGLYSPRNFPGQNTGVGSHSFLQGIFSTQGSNPGLPSYRRILYQLSHKGSPRILEWVAYPHSRMGWRILSLL